MQLAFYDKKDLLYLETDALGVGLAASLLQVRDRMQFPENEALDNAALQSIAFRSKSLTRAETQYI